MKPTPPFSNLAIAQCGALSTAALLRLGSPEPLTLRVGAVRLVVVIPVVGGKRPPAGLAIPCGFHVVQEAARAFSRVQEDEEGRRKKNFGVKCGKKIHRKKTEFQTAMFPPLSFRR